MIVREELRLAPLIDQRGFEARDCEDDLGLAATESAAQRARKAARGGYWQAGKRANAVRHGGTQTGKTVVVQRRKMRVQVIDLKPHRQRHVPPAEVRRAEHGDVSKGLRYDAQDRGRV